MKPIKTKVFDNEIDRLIDYSFDVASDGLYTIKITASAKAWWQHIVSPRLFLKKDSLAVRLDGEDSVPIVTKKKLNADDMWNGNVLKGHEMTLYIHVSLKEGNHTLSFVPRGKPFLGEITIFQLTDNTVSLANLTAQKRDRIPWITFLFHKTVIVSNVSITATAEKRKGDDDDLQIRFDGMIEKNETPRAHRDWFWCGKVLKGDVRTFTRSFPREKAPKRIDVIVDESPTIVHFLATIASDPLNRMPTVDDPRWTGNFRDDSDQMILARAIFGEGRSLPEHGRIAIGWVIRNRVEDQRWGNTYYDVILAPSQFSAFNEDDRNRPIVENPARNRSEQKAWRECYDIGGKVIHGTVSDPTAGANHYHTVDIGKQPWTRNMDLTFRAGNTIFFRDRAKNKKIRIFTLFFLIALLLVSATVFAVDAHRRIPAGFEYEKGSFKEHIADDRIVTYYGCGTECQGVRIIDIKTAKIISEFNYGVGYQWSADKKYVVAVHSSAGYGFTVGDMFGDELLIYTKPLEKYFYLFPVTQWAPYGERLAVLVQDDEKWYDLFVLWDFETTMRATSVRIPFIPDATIAWDSAGRVVSVQGIPVVEIDESGYGHHVLVE